MRSSIEGLNQEIEKLVLHPGPAGRANRLDQVSALRGGGTPDEGHQSPLVLHGDDVPSGSRSANTQTPVLGLLETTTTGFFAHLHHSSSHSDDSTPEDEVGGGQPRSFGRIGSAEASPRINKFMAQLPPEGCERVVLSKTLQAEDFRATTSNVGIIKPVAGFQLRPSQGSAFRLASNKSSAINIDASPQIQPEEATASDAGGVVAEESGTGTSGECSGTSPAVVAIAGGVQ